MASQSWDASPITVGAFQLSGSLVSDLSGWQALSVSTDAAKAEALEGKPKVDGARYYIGESPGSPKVGDIRVSFEQIMPGTAKGGTVKDPYGIKTGVE